MNYTNNDLFSNQGILKTDMYQTNEYYTLKIEVAGFKKEDIQILLKDGNLTIQATKKPSEGKVIHQERFTGKCSRSFQIGNNITPQDIKASFDNGELIITVPTQAKKQKESTFIQIF
ncbi:MAG: Hsp20/alpha crystallin family protein [Erysipelotrichaceae bacterium]|uniref:Hsp20/alpha crystallin family protein n=1 Tax=Floccifex sp. TaxID=2815810 RepID=UPI002A747628|nr:Hsp20/alpha crystallin family protein [Floccifex sp.]MDD7281900.1 Hsp20/alpha crystallin family protein [Erysipelotrichaceae bacterium]MDY2957477.1 Hsp20/alpha crystallin family protein [Floccifex sp.]